MIVAGAGWQARLAPADGAAMTALRFQGLDVLVPAPEPAPLGGPFGAFWMIPWANRIDGGRLGAHRLPVNRPQDGTAIHGLSRDLPWRVTDASAGRAVLAQDVDAPPYRYAARLGVAIQGEGLTLDLVVTNAGEQTLPFGAGWHPWFVRPPGTRLTFRADRRLRHDARCLPVSAEPSRGLDGGEEAFLGLDTHFAGWDGTVRIAWPGLTLTMTATGDLAAGLQVYAPRDRAVLCVEPSSHLPDAVNRPALAPLGPMRPLAPGGRLAGRIRLECSLAPVGAA